MGRAVLPKLRLPQAPSYLALSSSRGWVSTDSLGSCASDSLHSEQRIFSYHQLLIKSFKITCSSVVQVFFIPWLAPLTATAWEYIRAEYSAWYSYSVLSSPLLPGQPHECYCSGCRTSRVVYSKQDHGKYLTAVVSCVPTFLCKYVCIKKCKYGEIYQGGGWKGKWERNSRLLPMPYPLSHHWALCVHQDTLLRTDLKIILQLIIEWPELKRTKTTIEFQPPCYVQGRQPPDQAAQSHIQPGPECLQGWGIHNLLGQPKISLKKQT